MAANTELLQVKRLSEFAVIPSRGSEFSAGFDLSSAYDAIVPKNGKALIKTDLAIAIPENTYARIGNFFKNTIRRQYKCRKFNSTKEWFGVEILY